MNLNLKNLDCSVKPWMNLGADLILMVCFLFLLLLSVEIVRAMTHVINQGMTMYWGTSRWTAMEIMVSIFTHPSPSRCRLKRSLNNSVYFRIFRRGGVGCSWSSRLTKDLPINSFRPSLWSAISHAPSVLEFKSGSFTLALIRIKLSNFLYDVWCCYLTLSRHFLSSVIPYTTLFLWSVDVILYWNVIYK